VSRAIDYLFMKISVFRMRLPNVAPDWFKTQGIQVTDERTQVDTYLSCVILAESVGALWGNFVRDYLLETYENMLSFRTLNGYYPHLSLGPGQRLASKGGYIVHYADVAGTAVVQDGEWTVP